VVVENQKRCITCATAF